MNDNTMHTMHREANESLARRLSDAMSKLRGSAGDCVAAFEEFARSAPFGLDTAQGGVNEGRDLAAIKTVIKIEKSCGKCNGFEFYKSGKCKPCTIKSNAEWRLLNGEKSRAASAAWRAADPERNKAVQAAWKSANPEKIKADGVRRYAANPQKAKAATKAWNTANPGKAKARSAAYRLTNPEKVKAACNAWRSANTEKIRITQANWRASNREVTRIHHQNRSARKRASNEKLSKGLIEKLFALQKGMCPCCNQPLGKNYQLDHIHPLALGGLHTDSNIQLLRQRCNAQKKAKHPVDFMQSRGFLL